MSTPFRRSLRSPRFSRSGAVVALVLAVLVAGAGAPPAAAQSKTLPTIEAKTEGMKEIPGLFNLYWDEGTGHLYWEIGDLGTPFLYVISMGSGLGSNPIGIDRGQVRGSHVVKPMRIGPKLMLMQPNYEYVAKTDNPTEVEAVSDAFAPSIQWGFDIIAESGGHVLVDGTDFFVRDARNVIGTIARAHQGTFKLDKSRSAVWLPATKSFPENTEVEVVLTFTGDNPGPLVRGVAADADAVTLREHHSFVKLPGPGFKTRIADPRIGVNGPDVYDYAKPIDQDMAIHLVARHRLQKKDPNAERSEPVEPIVYYLDPGTPEPVRSALLEGVGWWNQAFEAAGFINAFQVRMLPDSVDPDDVRYNIIHWTHRKTRGYSYGNSIVDPRTGEIIRGVVNLGSLRLRQDYLHGQGLVAPFSGGISENDDGASGVAAAYSQGAGPFADGSQPFDDGTGNADLSAAPDFGYLTQVAPNSDAVEMALARVRQLGAHEVGHTLGFPHNYMASSYGRESVMDYPAPLIEIDANGNIDLSNAYLRRIGEYDKLAVNYLYREFKPGRNEAQALDSIVRWGMDQGLRYMGHTDNVFYGGAHQYAGVWDNGANMVTQLQTEIKVRQIGLDNFGPQVIRQGEPLSRLEFVLLPLYMHHRFQLRSAVESLGGADYRNPVRGDGQKPFDIVPGAEQRRALNVVLSTLAPDFLALPRRIVDMIPPPADRNFQGEMFPGHTELIFDPLAAAEAAANFTVGEILQPERMARLVVYHGMGDYPGLEEVADKLIDATWGAAAASDEYHRQVQHVAQRAVVDKMMMEATSADNPAEVRAVLADRLDKLATRIETMADTSPHAKLAAADIRRWENRADNTVPTKLLAMPAGDPIGGSSR
ncbi:MAG: zinc-dependent metalloprotease [Gemmatimonadota bacterium]|jgi:hypothetical protein